MSIEITLKAQALHFQEPGGGPIYVCGRDKMDLLEFLDKYDSSKYMRATYVDEGNGEEFFMMFHEDCYDPPIAIVRADSFQDAMDEFADNVPWARISDEDLLELQEEHSIDGKPDVDALDAVVGWTGQGVPYYSETMMGREVKLVHVEL